MTGTGRFVGADGTATDLPRATVRLWSGNSMVAETTAGADSNYAFDGVADRAPLRVTYSGRVGQRGYFASVCFETDRGGNIAVPNPPRAFPNLKNHTWIKPYDLTRGASADEVGGKSYEVRDVISRPYESTWYKVSNVPPGTEVVVELLGDPPDGPLPADYTLLGYTDVRRKAQELCRLTLSDAPVVDLRRVLTGDTSADDMESDDMESDDMESDDMESDDMESDDMESDDMESDDMESDDMESDDMESDDMESGVPNVGLDHVYASAQRRALRAASVTLGTATEVIYTSNREPAASDLYFRVRGHHGAANGCHQFTVRATVGVAPCTGPVTEVRSTLEPRAETGQTAIFITHTGRIPFENETKKRAFVDLLRETARAKKGFVVDLADDKGLAGAYDRWDANPTCVARANAIMHAIRAIIERAADKNALEHVVLVGPDSAIPFARIPDRASIARESHWSEAYQSLTPLAASLDQDYFLSDAPYGARAPIDKAGTALWIPTRAVGRLVESAEDIIDYLRSHREPITLGSALVTGYDFVIDLTDEIKDRLTKAHVGFDELTDPAWSAQSFRSKLFGGRHDLIAAEGHYSADRLKPADKGARFYAAEIARDMAADRFAGALWATMGCHSGHDILDAELVPGAQQASFAETLLAKGGTLVAGTGYQYGETNLVKNSELLYLLFIEELLHADRTVGKALLDAKHRYLDQLEDVRGIDEKALGVATLYGLPMVDVRLAASATALPRAEEVMPEPRMEDGPVPFATLTPGFTLTRHPADGFEDKPAYYDADGTVIAPPLRPIVPAKFRTRPVPGVAAGALWLSGRYETKKFTPLISTPATERMSKRPSYTNSYFAPARPLRLTHSVTGKDTVVVIPMQIDTGSGSARIWATEPEIRVYAAPPGPLGAEALHDAPLIYKPVLTTDASGNTKVSVSVRHYRSADEPIEVYASYLTETQDGKGTLSSLRLDGGKSTSDSGKIGREFLRVVEGTIPAGSANAGILFQAVGGNGRVSALTNNGTLYRVVDDPPTASNPKRASAIQLEKLPAKLTHRDRVTVRATWTGPGSNDDREVVFRLGRARKRVKTKGGKASCELTVAVHPGHPHDYVLTASFAETEDALPSSASARLQVQKATTTITLRAPGRIRQKSAAVIGTLGLDPSKRGLGEQPMMIRIEGRTVPTFTETDGSIVLDLGAFPDLAIGPHDVHVECAESFGYVKATPVDLTIDVTKGELT